MTEVESLEKSIKLWNHLASNPEHHKRDAYAILEMPLDTCYCPCCAYCEIDAPQGTVLDCDRCSLFDLWPIPYNVHGEIDYGEPCRINSVKPCLLPGSPFYKWCHTDVMYERCQNARIIAEASEKALTELKIKQIEEKTYND